MPTEEFQTVFGSTPNGNFDVTMLKITAAQIHETAGELAPTTILHLNLPFVIDVQWDVTGRFANRIGGNWDLHAYLEHMGAGPDLDLTDPGDHIIPLQAVTPPHHYHISFDVPAGRVTHEGSYKLFVAVTYTDRQGVPDDMAGYWEGPILQFYP